MPTEVERILMSFGFVLVLEAIWAVLTCVLLLEFMESRSLSAEFSCRQLRMRDSPQLFLAIEFLRLLWTAFTNIQTLDL